MKVSAYHTLLFRTLISVIVLSCLSAGQLWANSPEDELSYQLTRTDESINIDGVLSEAIWSTVPVAKGFWMSYPVDDRRVEQDIQTEVRITYDQQFLYIAAASCIFFWSS